MSGARGRAARRSWTWAALVLVAVVAVDQATKAAIRADLPLGERRSVVPGVVSLVHTTNDGVAFGVLAGRPVVLVIVLAALAGLLAWFALHATRPLLWLPTGLLLGGALGNVIDRLRHGAVTDFIRFPHWPEFNAADAAITIGVVCLLILLERGDAPDRRP